MKFKIAKIPEIDIETKQANEVVEKPRKNIEDSLFSALEENDQ